MAFEWGSGRQWRTGGDLAVDTSQAGHPPGVLKRQIIDILQSDQENVPRSATAGVRNLFVRQLVSLRPDQALYVQGTEALEAHAGAQRKEAQSC